MNLFICVLIYFFIIIIIIIIFILFFYLCYGCNNITILTNTDTGRYYKWKI